MRALLDTSVLLSGTAPDVDAAISAVSLAELHFGVLTAPSPNEQALRLKRLAAIEAEFEPLPVDAAVAREYGRLAAYVKARDANPRRRALDLLIAATANVHRVPLLTRDAKDFAVIRDLVDVQLA